MKIEDRTQNTEHRIQRIVLLSAVCVLTVVFSSLSYSNAAICNPEYELRSYLADNYPWEEIEVSNVQMSDQLSDKCPERIQVEKGPLGRAVFAFIFSNDERIMVSADVKAYGQVIMTKRSLQKRHVVAEEDIYLSRMDIGKLPANSVGSPGELLGKSLKRSVKANIALKEDMVEMSQLVERGKSVVILLSHEGMIIRTVGKTKEKGYVGMPVKAINISSKKIVSGVLIDENTVKVEL